MNSKLIKNEVVINWIRVFKSILRKWWLLLLALIVGLIAGFGVGNYAITPTYQNNLNYVVTYGEFSTTSQDYNNYSYLRMILNNCIEYVQDDLFFEHILNDLNNDIEESNIKKFTVSELASAITMKRASDTNTKVVVTVKSSDSERAEMIALAVEDNIESFIRGKGYQSISFNGTNNINNTTKSVKLSPVLCALIGAVALVCIVGAVLLFKALSDSKVYEPDDVKNKFNVPVLGNIPNFGSSVNGGYEYYAGKK